MSGDWETGRDGEGIIEHAANQYCGNNLLCLLHRCSWEDAELTQGTSGYDSFDPNKERERERERERESERVRERERERKRNVLFNDALNTFYLWLYGYKDHSDSEKGNPLPPHRLLLSISSNGSFICTIPQTG